jgi:hypothetical protein
LCLNLRDILKTPSKLSFHAEQKIRTQDAMSGESGVWENTTMFSIAINLCNNKAVWANELFHPVMVMPSFRCFRQTCFLRLRLHCSQKRHNTTVWTNSRQGSRNRVATFNPKCVSRLLATQGLLVLCLL